MQLWGIILIPTTTEILIFLCTIRNKSKGLEKSILERMNHRKRKEGGRVNYNRDEIRKVIMIVFSELIFKLHIGSAR